MESNVDNIKNKSRDLFGIVDLKQSISQSIDIIDKDNAESATHSLFGEISLLHKILQTKTSKLREEYNFTLNYSQMIINISRNTTALLFERTTNTISENKHFLKFFKEITNTYKDFSDSMKKTSLIFKKDNFNAPKMFDDNISQTAEKTQLQLTTHFLGFSDVLKGKILSKGPFVKIDQIASDIQTYQKEINTRIGKIEYRRKKIQKLYMNNYDALFKSIEDMIINTAASTSMEETNDYIIIELALKTYLHKMYNKTSAFLTDIKEIIKKINGLVNQFIQLIKEAVLIYIEENKKIFSQFLMQTFAEVEQNYQMQSQSQQETLFLIEKMFNQEKDQTDMDVLLTKYQATFLEGHKEIVKKYDNHDHFTIGNYKTLDSFFVFLYDINPTPEALNYDNLLVSTFEVRRYAGFFAGWKNCIMMVTKQKHMIVFDENVSKNYVHLFEISKLSFKSRPEKDLLYQLEIIVNAKGKVMNASTGAYLFDAKNGKTYDDLSLVFKQINVINDKGDKLESKDKPVIEKSKDSDKSKDENPVLEQNIEDKPKEDPKGEIKEDKPKEEQP